MRATIVVRLATVTGVLLAAAGIGTLAPASACACGGVVSSDETASVSDEVALVDWDGRRETILMQLALQSGSDNAALIVPTPNPATVAVGSASTFTELERLTAPLVVTDRRWFGFGSRSGAEAGGATSAPDGTPTVLGQVRLGPLEATTLSGGDSDGIQNWLSDNGYEMRQEVIAALDPYLREGWSFVAVRLTSTKPLDGALDPIRLTFDSDRLVYPMRMSRAATHPQSVRLYLLSDKHQTQRTDGDAAKQSTRLEFAGRIRNTSDPDLKQLTGKNRYLTELRVSIREPSAITTDFTFASNDSAGNYRQRIHHTEDIKILGFYAGPIIYVAVLLVTAALFFALIRIFRLPSSTRE
jgi:hypothetical protein